MYLKPIETALEPLKGYLASINRNPSKGQYNITIGILTSWVFNDNDKIGCEIVGEMESGNLLNIYFKSNKPNEETPVDDLILFAGVIIETNKKIEEKTREFAEKMAEMKESFEVRAKEFYKELDDMKENSFKKSNDLVDEKKESKPKKAKTIVPTESNEENLESIEAQ